MEKALSEVKEHCTEAGLLRENKQKVIDSEREVSEREKDLRKAMGKGDPEKIEKRKAKLAEARAELEEAKKGLEAQGLVLQPPPGAGEQRQDQQQDKRANQADQRTHRGSPVLGVFGQR